MSVSGGGEWVGEVEGIWRSMRKRRGVRPQAEPEWGWNAGKDLICQCKPNDTLSVYLVLLIFKNCITNYCEL